MPEPISPIRALRESMGLSSVEFARKYNILLAAVLRLEHGTLDHVPYPLVVALQFDGYDGEALEQEYAAWFQAVKAPQAS